MKVNRIANFINNSKKAQAVLKSIDRQSAMAGAVTSFVMASMLRPVAMEALPFKDKKDKQYSQASAVAAGLTEIAISTPLFLGLSKTLNKSGSRLIKEANTIYHKSPDTVAVFKSLASRGIKVLALIPISFTRFSLVNPIVKNLFGGKNENK